MAIFISPEFSPIPFESLKNIFQIGNPNIYKKAAGLEHQLLCDQLHGLFDHVVSAFADEIAPSLTPDNARIQYVCGPEGSCFAVIELFDAAVTQQTQPDHGSKIGIMFFKKYDVSDEHGTKTGLKPYFSLTGIINKANSFHPCDAMFRGYLDGEEYLMEPETAEDIESSICYGECAFELILAEIAPRINDCDDWTSAENRAFALERFKYLSTRDATQLSKDILEFHEPEITHGSVVTPMALTFQ